MNPLAIAKRVTQFWDSVDAGAEDECWPWLGYFNGDGYGEFYFCGRMVGAHELALSFSTGERRAVGLMTCHSCHHPPCCNPYHLRFDTHLSNIRDMAAAGRCRNGSTKLTAEQVVTIRQRRAAGASQKALAKQYDISDGQVSMIVRGIRWPNAGGPIETERKYCHVG